ncbi:MAG: hypothetical protein RQ862_00835 [Candidatus Caldarchaeales archaeon]|nr:hypothetical protein [Candidatus Caldarchaeales archaeon]
MTRDEVELVLNLYNYIMNANEKGTIDQEKDAWWTDLGSKIELLSTVLRKETNKQRLYQWAQKCKKVMKDTISWLNRVEQALSKHPQKDALLTQIRAALEQGRQSDLLTLKADIHEVVVDELSKGGEI